MFCVTSVSYSVLVNGKPRAIITPTRGFRQGDPLSSYLFFLCAKGLSSLLNQAENSEKLHGATVKKGGISINHVLFADDCVLFCKATTQEWFIQRDI